MNTWVSFSSSCAACRRWLPRCKPRWGWSLVMIKVLNIWMHQVLLFWLVFTSYIRFWQWLLLILHFGPAFTVLNREKCDVMSRLEKIYASVTFQLFLGPVNPSLQCLTFGSSGFASVQLLRKLIWYVNKS